MFKIKLIRAGIIAVARSFPMGWKLQIQKREFIFAVYVLPIPSEHPLPFLENLISKTIVKTKNQVMKKFRLLIEDENAQARFVIAGFVMAFALLFIFFF